MKIITNYAYKTFPVQNQQRQNRTNDKYITTSKTAQNNNINFSANFVKNILNPFRAPKTSIEAIDRLSRKNYGCYFKNENGVIKQLSPEEFADAQFNYGNIIIKQPIYHSLMHSGNDVVNSECRLGITPMWILNALRQKIGRITFIVGTDNQSSAIQTLHLPKSDEANKEALKVVERLEKEFDSFEAIKNEINSIKRAEYMFNATKQTVESLNIKGLVLEDEYKLP